MKALRTIGNVIIGIILFALIFTLSFTRSTKNILEKDVILNVIKSTITETIKEESGKITDNNKELIDNMLNDNDVSNIVRIVIDNYENYRDNKGSFKVSDADVEKIYSYALKYKDTIIEVSGKKVKNMSDAEFKELFSAENINKLANEVFSDIDDGAGEGIDIAVTMYGKITSDTVIIVLIISIIFFILLLFLINWSLYKWMQVTGIGLIVSGVLICMIFIAGVFLKDTILAVDSLKDTVSEINIMGYAIWGSIEIVTGILLIVLYCVIKKKNEVTPVNSNNVVSY